MSARSFSRCASTMSTHTEAAVASPRRGSELLFVDIPEEKDFASAPRTICRSASIRSANTDSANASPRRGSELLFVDLPDEKDSLSSSSRTLSRCASIVSSYTEAASPRKHHAHPNHDIQFEVPELVDSYEVLPVVDVFTAPCSRAASVSDGLDDMDEDCFLDDDNAEKPAQAAMDEDSLIPEVSQEVPEAQEEVPEPIVVPFTPPANHVYQSGALLLLRTCLGGNVGIATTVFGAFIGAAALMSLFNISLLDLVSTVWIVVVAKYVYSNFLFWWDHMRENGTELRIADLVGKTTLPFLRRRVQVRPHAQREGKNVWVPTLSDAEANQRGFALFGLPLLTYFHDLFSWALEYKLNAFYRLLCCDLGIGEYAREKATQEDVYFLILNSSLACFIDSADGKLKLFENRLPFRNTETKFIYSITAELDHANQKHVRTFVQFEKPVDGVQPEVLVVEDPTEMIHVYSLVGALKSHVHIHWWCNAVRDLKQVWPLAELSNDLTQGFNSAAQFSTGPVFNRDADGMQDILAGNAAAEGLPVHSDLGSIAENSLVHRMTQACRQAIKEVAPHLTMLQVEAIVMATVMHAADHYYPSSIQPWRSYSHLLESNLTPYRSMLIHGTRYYTRKLLCRQFQEEDVICRAIYHCCFEFDPFFADTYLTVGIAA